MTGCARYVGHRRASLRRKAKNIIKNEELKTVVKINPLIIHFYSLLPKYFFYKNYCRKSFSRARHRVRFGGHPCRTSMGTRLKDESPSGASNMSESRYSAGRVRGLSEDRPLVGKAHGAERRGEQRSGRQSYLGNRLFNSQFFINPKEC
jgi:hypothetical protein